MSTSNTELSDAITLLSRGELSAAEVAFRQLLDAGRYPAEAYHFLGVIAYQKGQPTQAIQLIEQAIALNPREPAFFNNLGVLYRATGRAQEALRCYESAVTLAPGNWESQCNLGETYRVLQRFDEAIRTLSEAQRLNPKSDRVAFILGQCWYVKKDYVAAGRLLQSALAINPEHREALLALALVFLRTEQQAEAELCCSTAMVRWADHPTTHSVYFNCLFQQGKAEECKRAAEVALARFPKNPDLTLNLGYALCTVGEFTAAEQMVQRASNLGLHDRFTRTLQGQIRLLQGDFARGLADYELRFDCEFSLAQKRQFSQPTWQGESLNGRTILLWCEQGLGDTLMFVRFAELVKQRGGRIVVECPTALRFFLQQISAIDELVVAGEPLPAFDVQLSLVSLPFVLGTRIENIPNRVPYLAADAELVSQWRERLSSLPGKKVGIAWQGNPKYAWDRYRSVPLSHFVPLGHLENVTLVSLQKGPGEKQIPAAREKFPLVTFDGLDESAGRLMDTAAILRNLDLFITTDCGLAHLAGAMGVRTWVILGHVPEWRWLIGRDDSPWYPTMRLFRQRRGEGWDEVFSRVAAALQAGDA